MTLLSNECRKSDQLPKHTIFHSAKLTKDERSISLMAEAAAGPPDIMRLPPMRMHLRFIHVDVLVMVFVYLTQGTVTIKKCHHHIGQ